MASVAPSVTSSGPSISSLERSRDIAHAIMATALKIMALAATITLIFFASPLLPMAGVVLVPLAGAIAIGFIVSAGGSAPNVAPDVMNAGAAIFQCSLKISVLAGIELGKLIYTAKIAIIAGIFNASVLAVTGPVALVSGLIYLCKSRQLTHTQLDTSNF